MKADEFYQEIIREVIEKMRREFVEEGVSEDVLTRIEEDWVKNLREIKETQIEKFQEHERRK